MTISVSLNGEIIEQVMYSKENDFEQLIVSNAETIFGDKTIYIDAKRKISTSSLGGTIPDGFLIDLSDKDDPRFYLVEVELKGHDFFRHIFPQITKFFAFYRDTKQRQGLIETVFELLKDDAATAEKVRGLIGSQEVYKFVKDTLDNNQNVLIVIDGAKPEFKEIMDTYTDTWGKMVKVQIVNHFQRDNNDILTVEPPFQNLSFEDASTPSPEQEISEPSQYTEEFHLDGCNATVKDVYAKLKATFLRAEGTLTFSPTKNYIGIVAKRRIAFIKSMRKKVHLIVLMGEYEVRHCLPSGHHDVVSFSESSQYAWGGPNPTCGVNIYDTEGWEEIEDLVARLVEKHQEA
jgi:hypothetical protein